MVWETARNPVKTPVPKLDQTKKTPIPAFWEEQTDGYIHASIQPMGIPTGLKPAIKAFDGQDFEQALRILRDRRTARSINKPLSQPNDEPVFGAEPDNGTKMPVQPQIIDPVFESYRVFYIGLCYLATPDASRALVWLQKVKDPLRAEAQWYRALDYLKLKDLVRAKPILLDISNKTPDLHAVQAQRLLVNLK